MKKIYIFRHGETNWNKHEGVFTKELINDKLNENGILQAENLVKILKPFGIQYIFSSHLRRAHKTAQIIAKELNINIAINNNLEEHKKDENFRMGLTRKEIKQKVGEEFYEKFASTRNEYMDTPFVGGETKRELRERISKTIDNICKNTVFDTIGISTHGVALREFLRHCDFEDDSKLKNCEIVEAEFIDNNLKIIKRIKNEY